MAAAATGDPARHGKILVMGLPRAGKTTLARVLVRRLGAVHINFVCPTPKTRVAFTAGGPAFIVWMDRIARGRFEDTNRLFVPPDPHVRVPAEGTPDHRAERVAAAIRAPYAR